MGKIEDVLRGLVLYHGKRAAKEIIGNMPTQVRQLRRDVRALQKTVAELTKQVRVLVETRRREAAVLPVPVTVAQKARFSTRTLKSIRKRLDLTQKELAKLLNVSPVTITSWEIGKARPRSANRAQIVALRTMETAKVDEALRRQAAPAPMKPASIKRQRRRLEVTQADLARLLGVSVAAVTSWETGKMAPGRKSRCALAAIKSMSSEDARARLGRAGQRKGRRRPKSPEALSAADVRAIRTSAGLSQRRLARTLGVSVNAVSNWETGRSAPRASNVDKLLKLQK